MFNFIYSLFKSSSKKKISALLKHVHKINEEFEIMKSFDDDELRLQTTLLKEYISQQTLNIKTRIEELKKQAELSTELLIKEDLFKQIDSLNGVYVNELDKVLTSILPKAFAIVKETARRFTENEKVIVNASEYDKYLATYCEHIVINGDKAIWNTSWIVTNNLVKWEIVPYDVQLIGGIILHQGKIVEMATGEGKTLAATLPTFLNALTGEGVHVVTVNDYLARRDAEWMGPIFQFHGISVDCIDKHKPHTKERIKAYEADITYGTNNEFGFDYLRDNMAIDLDDVVQRSHNFAIIDEVDSILIDDARTPLIISGPSEISNEKEYHNLKPRVSFLYEAQKKLVTDLLDEAKSKINNGNNDEAGLALFRIYRGLPKYKPFIKFLSEQGTKKLLHKTENYYMQDNFKMMPEADSYLYFIIDEKNNSIQLTEKGIHLITKKGEDENLFVLPDISNDIANIELLNNIEIEEKASLKENIIKEYNNKSQRIHVITQLLKAYTLFEKDIDYVVDNGKIKIVDEQTGRILEGRRYSEGLHQAIEAKEDVVIKKDNQTYATITLQNYFKMYNKLAGMTGTAETEENEFLQIYGLEVVVAPTNQPTIRKDKNDKVYKTIREKFNAVIQEIIELKNQNRPVLVGTTSVEASELLSRMLTLRKIPHQVLNAKQHQKEAEIIANAGKASTVTIATNMAGRGTDIKLDIESKNNGGLAIIGTERHESRRIDRQLRGRAGRQGDPGTSQFFVSLEDNLMRLFGSDRIANIMDKMGLKEGEVIENRLITRSIERAQKKIEENNFAYRKRLLEYDNVINIQREMIYKKRQNALRGKKIDLDIMSMVYDISDDIIMNKDNIANINTFKSIVALKLGLETNISANDLELNHKALLSKLYKDILSYYNNKKQSIISLLKLFINENFINNNKGKVIYVPFYDGKKQIVIPFNISELLIDNEDEIIKNIQKFIMLTFIDLNWKEHLYMIDHLRQSVQNVVYEQKDPLLIYKIDAFELFKQFLNKLNTNVVSYLMNCNILINNTTTTGNSSLQADKKEVHENKEDFDRASNPKSNNKQTLSSSKIIGRNEKVSVKYNDGTIKNNVKYKSVEDDIANNNCAIID